MSTEDSTAKRRAYQREWYRQTMLKDPLWAVKKRSRNLSNYRRIQRESKARWRQNNPELSKSVLRIWQKQNAERFSVLCKRWRDKNPETVKAIMRKWYAANPEARAALTAKRKAAKINQLHPLANNKAIRAMHRTAQSLNKSGGVKWNVDHIIPLSCGGYEHELNMQLLPSALNISKNANPFWYHPEYKNWMDVPRWLWPSKMVPFYLVAETILRNAA